MLSCTEFIPLYSEFFKYLEKRGGKDAVMEYWFYISDNSIGDKTNPNSLASFIEREGGFKGAISYWNHTLSEEACDILRVIDEKNRYCYEHMRHCPSRGMLNSVSHIEPYHDYCEHCKVIYSRVLEKYGIVYERDHSKIDNAECSSILYEYGNPPKGDFTVVDGEKTVYDMHADDNKYLHRDFHLLGDLALLYCGEKFGDEAVVDFLYGFGLYYFAPLIERIKERGLPALREHIEGVYLKEEASELISLAESDNALRVKIEKCPAIEYMASLGKAPTKYYIEETRTVYRAIAEATGLSFTLSYYEPDGAAELVFTK